MKLSIIIPGVNDPYLKNTLKDISKHAKSEHEVIVVDGRKIGMRSAINKGVKKSKGEYIIKTDEHCSFDNGFDVKLLANIKDNWIVVPRRYALDVKTWKRMKDPVMVYERLAVTPGKLSGVRWVTRTRERKNLTLDETMVFQGSFYLMSRKHWDFIGGLQTEGYGEFAQEPVELALKTWLSGGKVMLNKNTWYAHKHRKFGRIQAPSRTREGNKYALDFWLNNRWEKQIHDFNWLMKRFGV